MNINVKTKIKNNYHVQCIDTITGKTTHDLTFHNVVLNNIVRCCLGDRSYAPKRAIGIGSGSGTPQVSDTGLFKEIKQFGPSTSVSPVNQNTIKITMQYTIPASASEVYDISEIGILWQYDYLYYNLCYITHAILADSEGNPIVIHKTDTDKVILTCELYYSVEIPLFDKLRMDGFKTVIAEGGGFGLPGALALSFSPEADAVACPFAGGTSSDGYSGFGVNNSTDITVISRIGNGVINVAERTVTMTLNGARIAEYPLQAYIRGITVCGTGVIKLPNEDVFPRYTLEGISVGIGDGETTDFKCPLNYFIKDTDIVYVNNVPLTRGVDYTIDNENNQDELVELSAGNDAVITGGRIYSENYTPAYAFPPIFRRVATTTYAYSGNYRSGWGSQGISCFDAANPLFFDFLEPRKLNLLRVNSIAPTNVTLELFGRNTEDEEWQPIITFIRSSTDNKRCKFETVTYRYIKLTTTALCRTIMTGVDNTSCPTTINPDYDTIEKCKNNIWFLGYVGECIKFTTPPTKDAVITMTAQTDIPMLSPNSVLDMSLQLNMTM